MIINERIKIKIDQRKLKFLQKLKGFENVQKGEIIEFTSLQLVDIFPNSILKLKCKCQKCNLEFNQEIFKINKYDKIILCKFCRTKRTNLEKYGAENVFQSKKIKEKIKTTMLDKYGVENISQNEEIKKKKEETCLKNNNVKYPSQSLKVREKIIQTINDKYGVDNISQNEEIKKKKEETCLNNNGFKNGFLSPKIKQTNLKKYGHENPYGSSIIREKIKQTNLEKYGVENVFQVPEIIQKIRTSLFENGTAPCSKQQKHIYELLGGELTCKLNYPLDRCSLDIAYPDEKIYIEYNGGGHYFIHDKIEDVDKKDIRRHYYIWRKYNMKLIKIVSYNDNLLDDEKMISLISECKDWLNNNKNTWIEINLNDMIIKSKKIIRNI